MSLFKARDFWSTACGHNEEFDHGSLCVANIDNDPSGHAKIITGSFQGVLRVFAPKERGFKVEDAMLEIELDSAILQLAAGEFTSAGGYSLAVLHPRKLVVYVVHAVGSSYLQLQKAFEHRLAHSAANMTFGPFGGTKGNDLICVQSFDGQLSVFHQESFLFSSLLPGFLVPGPLAYCPQSDSIVTCNAAFELESFKFSTLAAASGGGGVRAPGPGGKGPAAPAAKQLQSDWKVVLGEAAVDIQVGRVTANLPAYEANLVVVGEHTLFALNSRGQMIMQKRLDYHPMCCTAFPVGPGSPVAGGSDNLLVATHTRNLLLYRDVTLLWAAKTDTEAAPVALRVAEIGGVQGMVVLLDDAGRLAVNYLGTEPPVTSVAYAEGKELDYEAMDAEHRKLLVAIRAATNEHGRSEPPERLTLRAHVPNRFDPSGGGAGDGYSSMGGRGGGTFGGRTLTVKLYLTYDGPGAIHEVNLIVRAPAPVGIEQEAIQVTQRLQRGGQPVPVPLVFTPGAGHLPAGATAHITASYVVTGNQPRTAQLEVQLPLCLFSQVVPPVKNATYKLTVTTNRQPPQLITIFDEMAAAAGALFADPMSRTVAANVMSFQYYNGPDVTILVSKSGGRYRLQSDSFPAIWLVLQELVRRLTAYYSTAEASGGPADGGFSVGFEEALPLADFFELVERHFECRQAVRALAQRLEDAGQQFRSIQKRLLIRFKDKNPAPLQQLDALLDETYHSLLDLADETEAGNEATARAGADLAAGVQLLALLCRFAFRLEQQDYEVLLQHLSPEVIDTPEVGWEEQADAAMTHLLRTSLARSAKETSAALAPLAAAKDTGRLRKHISLVLERLSRGGRLAAAGGEDSSGGVIGRSSSRSGGGAKLYREPSAGGQPPM